MSLPLETDHTLSRYLFSLMEYNSAGISSSSSSSPQNFKEPNEEQLDKINKKAKTRYGLKLFKSFTF